MRILVVENYQATSLGLMRPALASAGAVIDIRRAHEGDPASIGIHMNQFSCIQHQGLRFYL